MTTWTRALVTGASTGIGEAFARELAREGTDLVVVARRRDALQALADELASAHGVTVEVLTADLGDPDDLDRVRARLADEVDPVELLVNNAGFGLTGRFHELDADATDHMLRVNITAVAALAHAAIPVMVARGRGGIVNVASVAGVGPTPFNAAYSGSKAFVLSFSEAIHEELAGKGIHVTCLTPGFTRTEFQHRADYEADWLPDLVWQTPARVARAGLDAVARGRAVEVPGFNAAIAALTRALPSVVVRKSVVAMSERRLPDLELRRPPAPRTRALITGASRGLGAEFARQLASGGTDLVLTARTAEDLEALRAELTGVDVELLVADLATSEGVAAVAKRLGAEPAIDLFVNNAGIGGSGTFARARWERHQRIIDVNVRAATTLAHAATEAMVARGGGSVINVSSLASFQTAPGSSIYAAGKAYFRTLSEAVHEELQGTGVRHLALCPGLTRTAIFEAAGGSIDDTPAFLQGEADHVVATALRRLDQPGATTVPYLRNRLIASTFAHLPRAVVRKLTGLMT